jgi:serine/threonine protein kinase
MIQCSRCGGMARSGAKFCPYCQQDLAGLPNVCPFCFKQTRPESKYCSRCGKPQAEVGAICPRCSRPNHKRVRYCVHCGSPLNRKPTEYPYSTGKLPPGVALGGRCIVIRKIAQGGMGAVYEAISASGQEQRLAVKEMSFSVLENLKAEQKEEMVRAFYREFDLLRTLKHPNLPKAYDYFEDQGRLYFLMEYLDGQTLEAILKSTPPGQFISTDRVLAWAGQLCDVLEYLHSQEPPIIYRDLKPSNVMELSCSNNLKLFDFGIARYYKAGKSSDTVRFGTDGYLAPEIIAHHVQTSVQTDIYALGVVLHELLTHRDPQLSPFLHPAVSSINPNVPNAVSIAIQHALELNLSRRVATAGEFKNELLSAAQTAAGTPTGAEQRSPQIATSPPVDRAAPIGAWPSMPPQVLRQAQGLVQQHALQAPSTSIQLSTTYLYLGKVPRGQKADGTLGFEQPPNITGQIESSESWLVPSTSSIKPGDKVVVIHAETRRLQHGKWHPQGGAGGFQRLPGFIRSWLTLHVAGFVPAVKKHEGRIRFSTAGMPTQEVTVRIDVAPPTWKVFLGWAVAIGILTAEVFILGLIIMVVLYLAL